MYLECFLDILDDVLEKGSNNLPSRVASFNQFSVSYMIFSR